MTLDFQACLSISSCKIKLLGEVRCKYEKVVRDWPETVFILGFALSQNFNFTTTLCSSNLQPRNESRCTSHRWLSPDRFKIYWFASILNQMTMKIRAEFVPGFWRVAKWGSWSCFTREFFEKTPASPVEKGNLQIPFFVYKVTGKSWFFSRNERGNWRVTYF